MLTVNVLIIVVNDNIKNYASFFIQCNFNSKQTKDNNRHMIFDVVNKNSNSSSYNNVVNYIASVALKR